MIVAVYTESIALWSAVAPVQRVEKLSRPERESRHRSKQKSDTFAVLLDAMAKVVTEDESNGFDSRA